LDRRLRVGAQRRSRIAPAASVAPRPQPLRRNPQLPSNLAQRPAAAYQKLQSLPLKFIRILTTCRTHKTPSCSKRSLAKVSTVSEEVQDCPAACEAHVARGHVFFWQPRARQSRTSPPQRL